MIDFPHVEWRFMTNPSHFRYQQLNFCHPNCLLFLDILFKWAYSYTFPYVQHTDKSLVYMSLNEDIYSDILNSEFFLKILTRIELLILAMNWIVELTSENWVLDINN